MKIALIAHHRKNDLLLNFSIAYRYILEKHELISFFSTVKILEDASQLKCFPLAGDHVAGLGQLASQAMFNEIDAVIYLRDPQAFEFEDSLPLQKACDTNNIPCATNLAEAEILIMGIERGDLAWRDLLR